MQDLRVTLVQTRLHWEDAAANLRMFDEKLAPLAGVTDLVVLPEMFNTGFTMAAEKCFEEMGGPTVAWLRQQAERLNAAVVGSLIIAEEGKFFNRLIFASPDGELQTYDKRHLFRMAGEEKVYAAGERKLVVKWRGWRICPLVCYDLRFPVWIRTSGEPYDLAVFVANWPERRVEHWRLLLRARAVENQCFVVGVNRVGEDGNGYYHSGDSQVVDPQGELLYSARHVEVVHTVLLESRRLQDYRQKFPAWMDADRFEIR